MTWYNYLLAGSSALFILQFLFSIFIGDLDTDVDVEFSDVFSFKGVLHFSIGFSLTLSLTENPTFSTYASSIGIGIIFLGGLTYIYRFLSRYLTQELAYQESIVNQSAEIYYWDDINQVGEAIIILEGRKTTIAIGKHEYDKFLYSFKYGDCVYVSGTRQKVYINKSN